MQNHAKIVWTIILFFAWTPCLHADGASAYSDRWGWHLMEEKSQRAIIAHDGKVETLLLEVHLSKDTTPEQAEQLVWIVPIPAPAATVEVSILRGFFEVDGDEPWEMLEHGFRGLPTLFSLTQIYPIPPFLLYLFGYVATPPPEQMMEIHVSKHLLRDGIELEVIETKSIMALKQHLEKTKVEFPADGLRSLESYIDQGACFVLYHIASFAEYGKAIHSKDNEGGEVFSMGIEVKFPTREGFFPLVASSALPGDRIEATVTAIGFFEAIEPKPNSTFSTQLIGSIHGSSEAKRALEGRITQDSQRLTNFYIDGAPKNFTRDLRFLPGSNATTEIAAFLITVPVALWTVVLLIFMIISVLSALLARMVWPSLAWPSRRLTIWIGLSNILTLIGVLIVSYFIAERYNVPYKRAMGFAFFNSVMFCGLLAVLYLALHI